ncbi:cation:proton antiporter regulatory subunit [Phytoactinopolyspora halotolerans]|uniref:Cation:proton antiporter regulatory subunit n=1 Tax=Phytoactinopolyspora halotolerans TaxID=1981512 RepID=A0A6L9S8L4_9ACTN|nr:cation:proton antiporter regulatory subunit [Phytoactinopolyspora halotolerans]NEE01556.1 cation:proton antiporter regulatory subunit [Phytoactinopolyspora halotolerans]
MGVRVEKTDLPGIGVRHEVSTDSGQRIGVVAHHDGRRDLVYFDPEDPDSCKASVPLTDDEAEALADILGTSIMLSQLADIRQHADGLLTEQLSIPADSPYAGHPLGDTQARTRTGVSIVAVLRGNQAVPSPGPDYVLSAGDVVVAVGTRRGLDQLGRLISADAA